MAEFIRKVPEGDTRERDVCLRCGFVDYSNPRIVVGTVVAHEGRVLMCRRAIAPGRGLWTLPAGYLENGETPEEGAAREALEEAQARIALDGVLGIYTVRHLSQVQILFLGRFAGAADFAAGHETLEAGLFGWDEIPWEAIAFPSVAWVLRRWRNVGAHDRLATPAFAEAD